LIAIFQELERLSPSQVLASPPVNQTSTTPVPSESPPDSATVETLALPVSAPNVLTSPESSSSPLGNGSGTVQDIPPPPPQEPPTPLEPNVVPAVEPEVALETPADVAAGADVNPSIVSVNGDALTRPTRAVSKSEKPPKALPKKPQKTKEPVNGSDALKSDSEPTIKTGAIVCFFSASYFGNLIDM
jgi:hypothetical protein